MPKNPSTQVRKKLGLRAYNKLYKAVKKYAKKNELGWDVKKVREFTKEKVQPEFKGERDYDIRVADIVSIIELNLKPSGGSNAVPIPNEADNYYNPLLISPTFTTGILWFDLDDYLSVQLKGEVLPKDLRFEINGGEDYGATGIIDILSYEYNLSGVHDIVENVRASIGDESEPEWVGTPVVRPNFQDDGQTDSYYLRFTLYVNGIETPPTIPAEVSTAQIPVTQETIEERRAKRKAVTLRKKELAKQRRQAKKEKEARKRPRPTKKEKPTTEPKIDQVERSKNVQMALQQEKEKLAESERLFKEGLLTKKQFLKEREMIMQTTQLAISKFKDGGVL
jgi:hypothetical protein